MNDILPRVAERTKESFILSTVKSCHFCIVSFDLWMSKAEMDTFVMIMHFQNNKWEPYHITVSFFETIDIFRNAMAL